MRGKKSYNIRNVEAHISSFTYPNNNNNYNNNYNVNTTPSFILNKNMVFENNQTNNWEQINENVEQTTQQQQMNEYINSKYGVSKYASNLVSGKMFKKI
jgi:hypothetical protein